MAASGVAIVVFGSALGVRARCSSVCVVNMKLLLLEKSLIIPIFSSMNTFRDLKVHVCVYVAKGQRTRKNSFGTRLSRFLFVIVETGPFAI